jgi:DNA-binding SARP family transcriptional activator
VQFDVLGPMRDRDVDLGRPQHRALVAALLVDVGRVVDVDLLIERMWGAGAGSGTLPSLHACISRIRKAMGPGPDGGPLLVTQPPGYRLAVPNEAVDAARFAALVAAARRLTAEAAVEPARAALDEALGLWRGSPYQDVRSDFLDHERARLEELRIAAVELAAELDLALGRHAELAERLPAVVAEHPLREGLTGSLMTALYRVGRQADALRRYEQTRARLADELGVDPSPELQRLHALVLRQDPALDPPEPRPAPAPAARPTASKATAASEAPAPVAVAERADVMVGRDAELATSLSAVRAGLAGTPTTAAVHGEAGIGKTRLVEEVAARVAADGPVTVAWGRSLDQRDGPAYWPWVQVLVTLAETCGPELVARALDGRGRGAAVLLPAALVPAALPPAEAAAPEVARLRLFDAVTAFLEVVAADRPVLVVLEDLHWSDPETADLTGYVAATLRSGRLALLVTVRDPSEAPEPTGRPAARRARPGPPASRVCVCPGSRSATSPPTPSGGSGWPSTRRSPSGCGGAPTATRSTSPSWCGCSPTSGRRRAGPTARCRPASGR